MPAASVSGDVGGDLSQASTSAKFHINRSQNLAVVLSTASRLFIHLFAGIDASA